MNAAGIERSCTSKTRYPSALIAQGVAAERYHEAGVCLRVYACFACAGYHLTGLNAEAPAGYRPPPTPRERKAFERRERERRGIRHGRRR